MPSTVTVVSSEAIEKLNFRELEDIALVTPGFTTEGVSAGGGLVSLRGLTFDAASGATSSIDFYLNDVPSKGPVLQNLFDISQIEVLRGPQGTIRGRSAPSGAITIATHKPDLSEFGGYASVTGTDRNAINAQGALNVPIASDRLALRVAMGVEENDADRVRSVNNGESPFIHRLGLRATLGFAPTDDIDGNVMWQHNKTSERTFPHVAGPGMIANGPPLDARDRRAVSDEPTERSGNADIITGQINWRFAGHELSYVGGYYDDQLLTLRSSDQGNYVPDVGGQLFIDTFDRQVTQELRLSSIGDGSFIDYTVGAYYAHKKFGADIVIPVYLTGAFGSPASPQTIGGPFFPQYGLNFLQTIRVKREELSFFGNATIHLTPRTDLTVGGRYIIASHTPLTTSGTTAGLTTLPLSIFGGAPSCGLVGLEDAPFPAFCDFPLAPGSSPPLDPGKSSSHPFIYSVTLSHWLSDDINAYASIGSSFRQGHTVTGVNNADNDADLASVTFLKPERSTTFEVGLKTTWLDKRLRANISVYHQKFDDLINTGPRIPYVAHTGGGRQNVSEFGVSFNADAVITGVDFDMSFQVTPEWSIAGAVSYADGHYDNDLIPCRDSDFDGVEDTGTPVLADFRAQGPDVNLAFCRSSRSISRQPRWSGNLQTEYNTPIDDRFGAYFRGLFSFKPKNRFQDEGFVVDSYGLLNLYTGVRSLDGSWDVGMFVKNATNNGTQLSRSTGFAAAPSGSAPIDPGYRSVSYTPPREFGLTVRVAFGSR